MSSAADNLAQYVKTLNVGGKNLGAVYGASAVAPSTFDPKGKDNPVFKGIDFTTGRTVNLGQYSDGFVAKEENPYYGKVDPYDFRPSETKPTEGMFGELLSPEFEAFQRRQSQQRREENLYDAMLSQQMFQSYIPEMERLAKSTRLTDYNLGMMADVYSPTRQQQRAASAQQQMATATGAEATMLGAVNQAAYNNAMANIAGLRAGMRRG
jgi:hypothetical protein